MPRDEQARQIERVADRIGDAVRDFVRRVLETEGQTFYAAELHTWVQVHAGAAPESASRIMRLLRQRGEVQYTVLDRSRSLYKAIPVPSPPPVDRVSKPNQGGCGDIPPSLRARPGEAPTSTAGNGAGGVSARPVPSTVRPVIGAGGESLEQLDFADLVSR